MFLVLFSPKTFTGCSLFVARTQVWPGFGGGGVEGRTDWGGVKMNKALPFGPSKAASSETLALTGLPKYIQPPHPRHLFHSMMTIYNYLGQSSANFDMHTNPLGIFLKYDPDPGSLGRGLRFRVSDKVQGGANVAGT